MTESETAQHVKELLELRITELEKRVDLRNADAHLAMRMAAEVAKEQRAQAKEVTEELRKQAGTYPTKEAIDARTGEQGRGLAALADRTASIETKLSNMEGRFWAFSVGLTLVFAGITLALRMVGK
jgi:hypothetical protein